MGHKEISRAPTSTRRGRDRFRALQWLFRSAEAVFALLPAVAGRGLLSIGRSSNSGLARGLRYLALRRIAEQCGEIVDVRAYCFLIAPERLSIGSRVSIHPFTYIDATGSISIGDDVSIAHGVSILSTEHAFTDRTIPIRDQGLQSRPTTIGPNVWIGAGVRILAGTSIGEGCVVAAGAVVKGDIPQNAVIGGVPARVIKFR